MSTEKSDHFAWLDDLLKRWPIIILLVSSVAWVTRMQIVQTAQANELKTISQNYPEVVEKLDSLNTKVDAVLDALGYEVKVKAYKRENVNI